MNRHHRFIACCIALLVAAAAAGQQRVEANDPLAVHETEPQWVDLRVVDQRVEDTGVLSQSLRLVNPGLQQSNDFGRVYEVPGDDGRFMRVEGALHAVFPQSEYSSQSDQAVIPPGTVFYIGEPSLLYDPVLSSALFHNSSRPLPGDELRWRTRIEPADADTPQQPSALPQPVIALTADDERSVRASRLIRDAPTTDETSDTIPAICADADYRARRLRDLLKRAALVELQREQS